jgi:hypothetical protein
MADQTIGIGADADLIQIIDPDELEEEPPRGRDDREPER